MSTEFQRPETSTGSGPGVTPEGSGSTGEPTRAMPAGSESPTTRSTPLTPARSTAPSTTPSTTSSTDTGSTPLGSSWADEDDDRPARTRHVVDRFDGAIGLFLLRVATAAVIGVRGLQKVQDRDATEAMLRAVRLPAPEVLGLLFGPVQLLIAVALVLGVAVRAAGLGIAISAVTALVLVNWATGSTVFADGVPGFNGDLQVLLAGVGLMFLGVGGGGFGLDRRFRNRGKA